MKQGDPIWVESLLTREEWKECKQKYPSSYNLPEPPAEFECEFKWRKGMGSTLSPDKIRRINERIDTMMREAKIKLLEQKEE